MSEELKPCPFCAGKPEIHTQMVSRYQFVSCSKCRCDGPLKERTRDAIACWNRRAFPTPKGGGGDENLQRCLWFVINVAPKWADGAWSELEPLARALLSSPRVEEVRREALEEAAQIADIYVAYAPATEDGDEAARKIAAAIRSLSPTDGAPANPQKVRTP